MTVEWWCETTNTCTTVVKPPSYVRLSPAAVSLGGWRVPFMLDASGNLLPYLRVTEMVAARRAPLRLLIDVGLIAGRDDNLAPDLDREHQRPLDGMLNEALCDVGLCIHVQRVLLVSIGRGLGAAGGVRDRRYAPIRALVTLGHQRRCQHGDERHGSLLHVRRQRADLAERLPQS